MAHLSAQSATVPPGHVAVTSNLVLANLEKVRAEALAAMCLMDVVTSHAVADRCRVSNTRWQLSQAGLRGCTALAAVFQYLTPRVAPHEIKALQSLQRDHLELLKYSSEYIGLWTLDRIQARWPDYCIAFQVIRGRMTTYISAERRIVFPMLKRGLGPLSTLSRA
jgi:hypothetical protein